MVPAAPGRLPAASPRCGLGGGEGSDTSSPPASSVLASNLLRPRPAASSPPSSPRSPAGRLCAQLPGLSPPPVPPFALGVPRSWPRGRGAGEGIARREGKQSQRDKRQPKPAPAVGSCPGRTHGAGRGRRSSCRQLPWKALVLEGAKERDFAARSFSSPGIFSSLCPLVSPDSAFLSAGGAEGGGWLGQGGIYGRGDPWLRGWNYFLPSYLSTR